MIKEYFESTREPHFVDTHSWWSFYPPAKTSNVSTYIDLLNADTTWYGQHIIFIDQIEMLIVLQGCLNFSDTIVLLNSSLYTS